MFHQLLSQSASDTKQYR